MATMPPSTQEITPEPAGDDTGLGDTSQGYVVELTVKSDGTFAVSKEPIQAEAEEENAAGTGAAEEPGDTFDNIGAALKAVLQIVKDNPIGESEQSQFEAGYGGGLPQKY